MRLNIPHLVNKYFSRQIAELSSPPLRFFGAILAFTHLATILYWTVNLRLIALLKDPTLATCWPFFESCFALRPFSSALIYTWILIWGVTSALALVMFLLGRVRSAYWLLMFASVLKIGVFAQDYVLMGNHNYILFLISFAYLFLPDREHVLRYLVVACYLAAGLLKLRPEWISGASTLRAPPIIDPFLLRLFSAHGALLELGFSFLLLATSPFWFYFALLQFAVFHLLSYQQVGFFFPTTMFCVLSIFLFQRRWQPKTLLPQTSTWIGLVVFAAFQIWPLLLSSDPSKTGEGRAFALHMVDARLDCEHVLFAKFKGITIHEQSDFSRFGVRRKCDPLVLLNFARSQCRYYKNLAGFMDIDIYLNVRKQTAARPSHLVSLVDVCTKDPSLSLWRRNDWVLDQ